MMKFFRNIAFAFLFLALSGCFTVLQMSIGPYQTFSTYQITELIDKQSGLALTNNNLFVFIRQAGKEDYQFHAENITHFDMQLPIGARVLILIEAPGYQDWELEI